MLYFAYGADMDLETLADQGVRFEKVINGRAKDYRLVFDKPIENDTGRADLQNDRGNAVEGVIWDIPEEDLAVMETRAGVNQGHYRREEIMVQTPRGEISCITFRASKFRSGLKPSPAHLQTIIRGAQANGLSQDYITFLRSHSTA